MSVDMAERLTLSVDEIASLLGICRNSAYSLAASGAFPVIRHGRRLLIPRQAFLRWAAGERTDSHAANN